MLRKQIKKHIGTAAECRFWHHPKIKTTAKSSIADSNKRRSCQIYEKLFYSLLKQCKKITPHRKFDFKKWKKIDENGLTFVSRAISQKLGFQIFLLTWVLKPKLTKKFGNRVSQIKYAKNLKKIKYYDEKKKKEYIYLTIMFKRNLIDL